ncbi:MAG: PhoH family protein [Lysobacterales bacterium]
MTDAATHLTFALEPADGRRLTNLAGPSDEHLRMIERHLGVEIANRGNLFSLAGTPEAMQHAERVLRALYAATGNETLDGAQVNLQLAESRADPQAFHATDAGGIAVQTKRGTVRGRGPNQRHYLESIASRDLTFGIGPAGTGKTYLAVAMAIEALQNNRVQRLVLVRPAVEAGEKLGFLPGDMSQKVDPYLRPLYDALYEMLGLDRVAKLIERNVIEIAPLAFMRGRSLNEAFVILDEAQNCTIEQMKMFLTRIGFGSVAVVTGDLTQTDLPRNVASGLADAIEVLKDVEGIDIVHFTAHDVVRHPLVQRIVRAYDEARRPGQS